MADWHLPLEDVLAFMDDDERARWDAASQEERDEMRRILSDLWYAIPDPTEAELERLMAPMDWAHCQRGENREGIRAFYIRKWKKDRKAEACKRLAETKPQSDSNNSPKPSSGIRVPAQWADRTEQERILQAAEKAHQKAFEAFLSSTADGTEDQINELFKDFPQLRAEYDRAAQPKRKQAIIETAKHLRREADKREEDRLEAEQQRITKAFDYWHQCQEKGIAAEKLPSKDAPIEEVLKWYDDTRKPVRSIPFPGEGGYSSNKTGGDTPPHPSTFNIFDLTLFETQTSSSLLHHGLNNAQHKRRTFRIEIETKRSWSNSSNRARWTLAIMRSEKSLPTVGMPRTCITSPAAFWRWEL